MDELDLYYGKSDKQKDAYYEEQSVLSIETALAAAAGKTPEEIKFLIRRSYPFGALRKGRPYKIWNRLVLAKLAELGIPQKKHKKGDDGS